MSEDRVNQWKRQGSRVYGNGQSYNCTNIVTAQQLQNTLNNLIEYKNTSKNIEEKLDKITKTVIQIQMTTSILSDELNKLHEALK